MRKNKLKIFVLLAFIILVGIFWGEGKVARAEQMVDCTRSVVVGSIGRTKTGRGEDVQCDLDQGEICAYYLQWTQVSMLGFGHHEWFPMETCVKAEESHDPNHCLELPGVDDPGCDTSFEGALYWGQKNGVNLEGDVSGPMPAYYISHDDYKIGCKDGFPPIPINAQTETIYTSSWGQLSSAEVYECIAEIDPGVYANACGNGRGVHIKDNQLVPTICADSEKECVSQTKGGQNIFLARKDLTVTRKDGWLDDQGQPAGDLHIKVGDKAYCTNYDEINVANCYLEADQKLTNAAAPNSEKHIEDVYDPNFQNQIQDAFRPHYECEEVGSTFWQVFNSTIGVALTTIFGLIASIMIFILGALFWLVSAFLEWVMGISKIDVGIIDIVWEFLRDFSNMFFIIILLYIAFCTVLRIQSQNLKKALPLFMYSIILINFSQVICQIVLDFSQVLIDGMYYLMPGNWWGRVSFVLHAGGMDEWMNIKDVYGSRELKDFVSVIGAQGLSILYMLAAVIVFGAAAFLLAIRIVVLWIMTAISPIIYVAMSIGSKGVVKKYWTTFLRTAFFAPVMIFCIVISIVILSYDLDDFLKSEVGGPEEVLSSKATEKIVTEAGSFNNFIQLVFALAFMCTGLVVARRGSVIGADGVVKGATKLGKMAAPWITGVKPAGYGVKSLASYGWRKALDGRAGKYLKVLSPKAWKEAAKQRRERVQEETYGKRVAELQPRLAGWNAFWRGKGPAYDVEKKRADLTKRKLAKAEGDRLNQTDEPSESFIGMIKVGLDQAEERGDLGTMRALTPLMEGAFRTAGITRGDWNDILKSKFLRESGYGIQRATTGADVRMFKQLFGDDPEAIQVLNSMAEASKPKYTHLAYATYFDEDQDKLIYGIDKENVKSEMNGQLEKLNERRLEAREQAIEFDDFYDEVIDNLGQVDSTVRDNQRLQRLGMSEEIANVIKFYNKDRSRVILGEMAKKDPKNKWTVNPGAFAAEVGGGHTDPKTGKYSKYYGETASTRAYIESATTADAERINSWAPPRMRQAILDNEKMVWKVMGKIEEESKQERAEGNIAKADALEETVREKTIIWNSLFDKIKVEGKPKTTGDTTMSEEEEAAAIEAAAELAAADDDDETERT